MTETKISVYVTGTGWMGGGIGSIESALERLFREAEHEILLTAYVLSSSVDLLFIWLEGALSRGIEITLVVNQLSSQRREVVTRLLHFSEVYPHFHMYDFFAPTDTDLHAKVVVIDRRVALVGSSNLSRRGLLGNHELALLVEGPSVTDVAAAIDRLITNRMHTRPVGSSR